MTLAMARPRPHLPAALLPAAILLGVLVVPACSDGPAAVESVTTTTTIAATTTTVPPTTTSTTTTTSSTTTTTEPLPVPESPPPAGVKEPVIELGTISIPAIGITETLYRGVSLPILDLGTGHWPGTAMPGHRGNVVVGGHRVSHRHPFLDVDLLVPGDDVIFTTAEGTFTYEVTSTEIVAPTEIRVIDQTDAYTATLFACHPKHSTRQRIIIHLTYVDA
ncbi:MAG: hypothetical protein RJB65_1579 [Actinomycetota bacterium]